MKERRRLKNIRPLSLTRKKTLESWIFISPWIIGFLFFLAYPFVTSFLMSFSQVNQMTFKMRFIGLKNYIKAFLVDTEFLPIYGKTIGNTLIDTPIIMFFSLIVAILLNRNVPFKTLFRGLFFLPVVIASGYVIQELFGQGVGGLAAAIGTSLPPESLDMAETAATLTAKTPSIINVAAFLNEVFGSEMATAINYFLNRLGLILWRSGIQILLFLAGLQGVPKDLTEASYIDGANYFQTLFRVVFPSMKPVLTFCLVMATIWNLQIFDSIYVLTRGGPANATSTMVWYIYENIFFFNKVGRGATMSVVLILLTGIITFINLRITKFQEQVLKK